MVSDIDAMVGGAYFAMVGEAHIAMVGGAHFVAETNLLHKIIVCPLCVLSRTN